MIVVLVDDLFSLGGWYAVISPALLILTVIVNPEGATGPIHGFIAKRRNRATVSESVTGAAAATEVTARERPPLDSTAEPALELKNVSVH